MAISTETIRKITVQAQGRETVDGLAGALKGLDAAQKGVIQSGGTVATVTDVATRRQLSAADAYKRQTLAIDDQARMHNQLERAIRVADAALAQGSITASDHAQRIAALNTKYGEASVSTKAFSAASGLATQAMGAFGLVLSVDKLVGWSKSVFEATAALQAQAQVVGVSVEALQAYRDAGAESGIAIGDMDSAIQRFTRSMGDANAVVGPARTAFHDLHLNARDLAGGAESSLPRVAAALLAIADPAERARDEVALFGKSGQEIEPGLRQLAQGTGALEGKFKDLIVSAQNAKQADDTIKALTHSFAELTASATPGLVAFGGHLADIVGWLAQISNYLNKIKTEDAWWNRPFGFMQQQKPAQFDAAPNGPYVMKPGDSSFGGANKDFGKAEFGQYLQQLEEEARLTGLSAKERAAETEAIAASVKMQELSGVAADKINHSYAGAKLNLDAQTLAHVRNLGILSQQNTLAEKVKETFGQYVVSLNEQAKLAGESTAQRETEAAVIKGAQVYQEASGVLARNQVKDYQGALDVLKAHGNLLPVINALEQKRDNELKLQNNAANDNLDILNLQISLVGKSNLQQAEAVALLKAQQALKQTYGAGFDPANPTDEQQRALDLAKQQADATVALTVANESYNSSLSATADLLAEMAGNAQDAAKGMADGFGKVGKAIGDVVAAQAVYNARQADFAVQREQINKSGVDVANRLALVTQKQANVEDQYYADSIDGLKNMFGQKTAAYKVLSAVEGTYNALRLAGNIEAMISDAAATALKVATVPVHVAANETIAASGVAAGAGQIFAELGPWGFPVVAAMLAVMLGLGFSGGGGGSSAPAIDIAKQRQGQQGAGTVLGDSTAKSDSIAKSLEELAKDTNTDLEYSNQMVTSLKAIENSIGSLTSLLARQLSVGGLFDTGGLNLGTNGGSSGGIIGALLGSIFGSSKTTNTLLDQGIQIAATTIGQAVAGGLQANAYQTVQSTKTSSALFGLISSSKTTTGTTATPLSSDFTGGIESIIGSLRATVLDAATKLGVQGAQDVVDSFALNLGSISFKGMTGSEIKDALTQEFGALGDNIAAAAVPQIATLQQVGEGALQTLARLVQEYTVVDDAAKVVGFSFGQVGVDSLAARDSLVQLSGGLDQFSSQANFFSDNFLTKAQALAPIQQAVTNEMARLGQAGITTKEQFAAVVQGIDASTTSGAQLYAALMNVAPAFVKVADAAADLADQRTKMQITLLNATGDAMGALNMQRAQELAALDASLVPLQNQIYAAQDAATAVAALQAANDNAAAEAQKQAQAEAQQTQAATAAAEKLAQAEAQQAQAAAALARTRAGLEITLMQDTGDAAGALALKRQQELIAIDASLVPLQNQIYAAEDLNAATAAAAAALSTSLNTLGTSISDLTNNAGKAAQAAQTTADSWGNAFSSITQAQTALLISGPGLSPQDKYNASRNQFDTLRTRALAGDASAASDEASFAGQFLQTSFGFNGATAAYGRDLSYVQDTLSSLAQYTKVQQDSAQATADALTAMASKLSEIADGIRAGNVTNESGFDELSGQVKDLADEIAQENLQARHA
jgi:hypothetical protein